MKHGKKTHYFYRCFVSCSNCRLGIRQLHAPYPASRQLLGALPCTSQLPAARAGQAQHCRDWNEVSILTLSPLLSPSLLLFPDFRFPVDVRAWLRLSKAPCSDSCLGYSTAAAWPSSSLKKLSYSGQKTPDNLRKTWG